MTAEDSTLAKWTFARYFEFVRDKENVLVKSNLCPNPKELSTSRKNTSIMHDLCCESLEFKENKGMTIEDMDAVEVVRAEVIRAKLVQTFYLHDLLQKDQIATPKYTIQDVLDEQVYSAVVDSHSLVKFETTGNKRPVITKEERRLARMKNRYSRFPPICMFTHWVEQRKAFSNIIFTLVILNSLLLGAESEISDNMDPAMDVPKLVLKTLDWCCLIVFYFEIMLKWLDDFWLFWKSPWNVFDFVITFLPLISELITRLAGEKASRFGFMKHFSKCRILICLKMVYRMTQIRLIVLAISKAVKAMSYILLLFFLFIFIFAVAALILFERFADSTIPDLTYKDSFKDMPTSLISLFILYTMDHWYALMVDVRKVPDLDNTVCGIYIILWLVIGSFFFRNIFMGVMVSNYQDIRNDLSKEVQQFEIQQKADNFKAEIIYRRIHDKNREIDWETYVRENMLLLKDQEEIEKVTWPRAMLFRYFELMEKLQYNLQEWMELQAIADAIFTQFHDSLKDNVSDSEDEST